MPIQDKLYEKYRPALIGEPGEEIFFESGVAMSIPADCETANVAIIGVDTFTITPGSIYPHFDGIMDFSPRTQRPWDDFRQQCNKAALKLIQEMCAEKGANTYFSFVTIDANDYDNCLRQLR